MRPGSRLLVPFGTRKLTGVIVRCHDDRPEVATRDALRLLDAEPVLDSELLALGRWISELLLRAAGRRAARHAPAGRGNPARQNLLADRFRPRRRAPTSARFVARRSGGAGPADAGEAPALRRVSGEDACRSPTRRSARSSAKASSLPSRCETDRDPLRAPAEKLRVELRQSAPDEPNSNKPERELRAFLELHPGSHNLKELEDTVKNASIAARSLARKGIVSLKPEPMTIDAGPVRAPPRAERQRSGPPSNRSRRRIAAREFRTFLLHGVTGSGKTEVYLSAIEAAWQQGRSALLLVPEIALTPQMAGQFFSRFGDRVAILHSAFTDVERSDQWRRIRSGAASVVVGTRSGVFAPVRNLGLIVVDEEHDGSYKQEETPRYNGRDVAIVRAQAAGACVILGSATPSLESRYNVGARQVHAAGTAGAHRGAPDAGGRADRHAAGVPGDAQAGDVLAQAGGRASTARLENGEQTIVLLNRRGFSSFVACRACGERVKCINCSLTLTYHKRDRRLLCHYCGYAEKIPSVCPKCASEHIHFLGIGSERVEEELHQAFPRGAHRAARSRYRDRQAAVRDHPAGFPRRQLRHPGGHADDRQGPRHSERHAGGRRLGGYRSRHAGFPRGGADVPIADAGGGARGARQRAGDRADPDDQSRSLRGAPRRRAGLPGVLREGTALPAHDALSAVRRDGEYPGAQREEGSGDADGGRSGHQADAAARAITRDGPRGGAGPAAEKRIPLPVPDQSGEPQSAERNAAAGPRIRGGTEMGRDGAGDRRGPAVVDVICSFYLIFTFYSPTIEQEGLDMALTKRQKQVLDFIAGFVDENGYCPSYEEIAQGTGPGIARDRPQAHFRSGIEELFEARIQPEPLAGAGAEVPAGATTAEGGGPRNSAPRPHRRRRPVETVEQRETLNFADFAGNGNTFALEVRGDSMIDDHICDGDMILLERVQQALDGDIVVALVSRRRNDAEALLSRAG